MKTAARFTLIFLLLMVAACVPFAQKTELVATSTATLETVEPAAPTVDAGLTEQLLRNMEYLAPELGVSVKLVDGIFKGASQSVTMLAQFALGDLNGDQVNDAAILLAENGGGTGEFVSLVVIASQGGEFKQVGSVLIDDRPIIQSLEINEGTIILDATIHGLNDAMVSPTVKVHKTYRLLENNLTLMSQSSTLEGGSERSIVIEAPLNGSEVSGSVQLKGSMPIAPFENNLRFRIVDMAGSELLTQGFMVQSADVGGPSVFDNEVTLPVTPIGTWVRLELAELSMADGSVVTLNSVLVKIK